MIKYNKKTPIFILFMINAPLTTTLIWILTYLLKGTSPVTSSILIILIAKRYVYDIISFAVIYSITKRHGMVSIIINISCGSMVNLSSIKDNDRFSFSSILIIAIFNGIINGIISNIYYKHNNFINNQ